MDHFLKPAWGEDITFDERENLGFALQLTRAAPLPVQRL